MNTPIAKQSHIGNQVPNMVLDSMRLLKAPNLPAGIEVHSFAQIIPPMSTREFAAFKTNIAKNGQKLPVIFYEGKILDGFHRYVACHQLNIVPERVDFAGSQEEARLLVLSHNLARRDISKSQKAIVLACSLQIPPPAEPGHFRRHQTGRTVIDKLAEEYGVSHVLLYQAARVYASNAEMTSRVLNGNLTLGRANMILNLEKTDKAISDSVLEGRITLRQARHLMFPGASSASDPAQQKAVNLQIERELALVSLARTNPKLAREIALRNASLPTNSSDAGDAVIDEQEEVEAQPLKGELRAHPINKFPRMQSSEYRALKLSIRANGLLEAITLYEGKVLDGRERYDACCEANVPPKFATFNGTAEQAFDFCFSLNFIRSNLNVSQRAMLTMMTDPSPDETKPGKHSHRIRTLCETSGISSVSLHKARKILVENPGLALDVRDGKISVTGAERRLSK